MFEIKEYNIFKLTVGAKYSTCPICSPERKKKLQKCMLLDWEKGLGTCQHCGNVIQLHSYTKVKSKPFTRKPLSRPTTAIKPTSYIEESIAKQTLKYYSENNLYQFLCKTFGEEKTNSIVETYNIGTANKWEGASIFWQKDVCGKFRTGKIMLYNANGKRVKKPYNKILWVHKFINDESYNLNQCIFGEHLINCNKPIYLVESEKTAIIAFGFYPNNTWIAVGGKNNFNPKLLKVLKGKEVFAFPDADAYSEWQLKANEFNSKHGLKIHVSDLIEKHASIKDKQEGKDLADYLIEANNTKHKGNISEQRFNRSMHISQILDQVLKKPSQFEP